MRLNPVRTIVALLLLAGSTLAQVPDQVPKEQEKAGQAAQQAPPGGQPPAAQPQPGPDPIPEFRMPTLPTRPVPRGNPGYNWIVATSEPLPKDKEGIWVLEFAYKPVRIIEVEVPNKGRKRVYYLYYRIVNRTGKPRPLVPQFSLITDDRQRLDDLVLPLAVKKIQAKEEPTIPLLGAVQSMGELPASTKDGVDDALYGVAIWPEIDHRADGFQIYVRGLSDAYQEVAPPEGGQPFTRYKALRLDFRRPGDERNPHPSEIQLGDPPYKWTYFPELGLED